jgi:hypothetical protein
MVQRRFSAQQGTVISQLTSTMKKMGCTSLKIDQGDLLDDKAVEVGITFDRNGRRYVFKCSSYPHKLDNLRAAQLTIEYLYRALEAYGVKTSEESLANKIFDNFLLGFEATPDDGILKLTAGNEWYEGLNVSKNATLIDVKNAYKSLCRVYHPDNGGSHDNFLRLKKAYDEGVKLTTK